MYKYNIGMRKIDLSNLENEEAKSLGKVSVKKLVSFWNDKLKQNFKTIAQFKNHPQLQGKDKLAIQKQSGRAYNKYVDIFRKVKKSAVTNLPKEATRQFLNTDTPVTITNKLGFDDHSFHFRNNPVNVIYSKLDKKYKTNVRENIYDEGGLTKTNYNKIKKMVYDRLLTKKKAFNRIFITETQLINGKIRDLKTVSTPMWDNITYDEFVNVLDKLFGYEGADFFHWNLQYKQETYLLVQVGEIKIQTILNFLPF